MLDYYPISGFPFYLEFYGRQIFLMRTLALSKFTVPHWCLFMSMTWQRNTTKHLYTGFTWFNLPSSASNPPLSRPSQTSYALHLLEYLSFINFLIYLFFQALHLLILVQRKALTIRFVDKDGMERRNSRLRSITQGSKVPICIALFFFLYVTSFLPSRFHLAPRMCLLLVYRSVRSFKYLLLCTVFPRSDGKR